MSSVYKTLRSKTKPLYFIHVGNGNVKTQATKWEKISQNSYTEYTNNKYTLIRKGKIGIQYYN